MSGAGFVPRARVLPGAHCAVMGALLCAVLLTASRAWACAGPCATPEVWGVHATGNQLTVETNFGLLVRSEPGWQLICEETTPGLFLKTQIATEARYVSTSMGLVFQAAPGCDFELLETGGDQAWLLDFALPGGNATADTLGFGVLYNQAGGQLEMLRGSAAVPFESVARFDIARGYAHVVAANQPASVFLSGYSFGPRTWNVAFSLDGGQGFTEVVPDADSKNGSFLPLQVNPGKPDELFVHLRTPTDQADELWLFSAADARMRLLFTLGEETSLIGFAVLGDKAFVAGVQSSADSRGVGSLYAASLSDLAFEAVLEDGPAFSCLASDSDKLYVCTHDFTRNSPYLVASSEDQGASFQPLLRLAELAQTDTCDEVCGETLEWLQTFSARLQPADAGVADAGLEGGAVDAGLNPQGANPVQGGSGCDCRLSPAAPRRWAVVLVGLITVAFRLRRHA